MGNYSGCHIMTKRKFLWLIAIAVMTVIISVACKKKPTDAPRLEHTCRNEKN